MTPPDALVDGVSILDWSTGKTVMTEAGLVRAVLWPGNGATRCTLHYARLDPGKTFPGHTHPESIDLVSVLSGAGEVLVADGSLPVRAGQSFYARSGHLHGTRNTGDVPLVTIGTQVPPDPEIYSKWPEWK